MHTATAAAAAAATADAADCAHLGQKQSNDRVSGIIVLSYH